MLFLPTREKSDCTDIKSAFLFSISIRFLVDVTHTAHLALRLLNATVYCFIVAKLCVDILILFYLFWVLLKTLLSVGKSFCLSTGWSMWKVSYWRALQGIQALKSTFTDSQTLTCILNKSARAVTLYNQDPSWTCWAILSILLTT